MCLRQTERCVSCFPSSLLNESASREVTSHQRRPCFVLFSQRQSGLFCFPKGKVVGILQKNWRDYVVTFPSKEEVQSQGKNAQKILVTPWDNRIPKIRISTQQTEALQVAAIVLFLLSLLALPLHQETQCLCIRRDKLLMASGISRSCF